MAFQMLLGTYIENYYNDVNLRNIVDLIQGQVWVWITLSEVVLTVCVCVCVCTVVPVLWNHHPKGLGAQSLLRLRQSSLPALQCTIFLL